MGTLLLDKWKSAAKQRKPESWLPWQGCHRGLGAGGGVTVIVTNIPAKQAGCPGRGCEFPASSSLPGLGQVTSTLCASVVFCGRRA